METAMERWYRATRARFSVRSYASDPAKEQLLALKKAASSLSARGVEIVVAQEEAVFTGMLAKIRGTTPSSRLSAAARARKRRAT